MRRESPRFGGLRLALKALHPVDKALLVFMAVLMAQSMLTMFFPRETPALSGDIDVVVRTSAAAVFGYFLSANFVGRHSPKGQAALEEEGEGESVGSDFPRDGTGEGTPIGFSLPQAEAQQPGGIHAKAPFAGSPHKLASGADFTPEPEASGVQEHTPEQGAFAADEPAARGGLPSGSQEPSGQEDGCPSCLQINLATTVYGTVTDGTSPIADATVKLFDSAGMPYRHTLTDENGAFSISDIPTGTYSLAAVKVGYRLSDAAGVTLSPGDTTPVELTCTPDATLSLGAIAGVLTTNNALGLPTPLGGAKITLKDPLGTVIAITTTADDGEFAFYDLADGIYFLTSLADGYLPSASMTAVITGGSAVNISMAMVVDNRTYSGTVSGIIRNTVGQVVADCFVGLYQVITVAGISKEVVIATTKTNVAGKYLFGNVQSGEYLVKAKLEQ